MLRYLALIVMLFITGLTGPAATKRVATPAAPGDETVVLSVTLGDRAPVTLVVVSGRTATVAIDGDDPLGLTPTVTDAELNLRVRALSDQIQGGTDTPVEFTVTLQVGAKTEFKYSDIPITIRWARGLARQSAAAPGQDECRSCCVTCEGVRYCACKVVTVCSECCCPECCNIIG